MSILATMVGCGSKDKKTNIDTYSESDIWIFEVDENTEILNRPTYDNDKYEMMLRIYLEYPYNIYLYHSLFNSSDDFNVRHEIDRHHEIISYTDLKEDYVFFAYDSDDTFYGSYLNPDYFNHGGNTYSCIQECKKYSLNYLSFKTLNQILDEKGLSDLKQPIYDIKTLERIFLLLNEPKFERILK